MALFNIAWRNIKEHKTKTLIVGIIITIGITVLVVGNSMMDTAAMGIKKKYIQNYTGDLIITSETDSNLTLLGAMDMDSRTKSLPTIPDYFQVKEMVLSHPDVIAVSGQAAGMAQIEIDEHIKSFTFLFGIDPAEYRTMFTDNLDIIDGAFLEPGEEGIILSNRIVERMEKDYNYKVTAGSSFILTGFNPGGGAKIREVKVKGIFEFKNSNPQLDMVSLITIDTLRSLNGMTLGAELAVQASENETDLMEEFSEDDLFGEGDSLFGDDMVETTDESLTFNEDELKSILGDTGERDRLAQTDSGAWHFLLVKIKEGKSAVKVMMGLSARFKEKDMLVKVNDWISGAGPLGSMADAFKLAFNILILIIAVVAIIIIMITLVISITERISEIGTMRALGAQKGFVRLMILSETIMISAVFGLIGIILGSLILFILGATGISAPNMFFEMIFGGKVLYPVISMGTILQSIFIIFLIGIISSLYPVAVALKIQPVTAIQSK
jgi:putative ABC transport system permease protein